MQHRQQQWSTCNNNQNRGRRTDFSGNGSDQKRGQFEEKRIMNRTPSPNFKKGYDWYEQRQTRRSPSPYESYGANSERKGNQFQNDYPPRGCDQISGRNKSSSPRYSHWYGKRDSRRSPSPRFDRNNEYNQRRRDYSPRKASSPYNNCQRHSDNRHFNCSTSRNRSSSPYCNQCNNWRQNDYSPRRSPSPRINYQGHIEEGYYNYSDSRNRSPSPCYSPCNNGRRYDCSPRRSPIPCNNDGHQDKYINFERYQSLGPNMDQSHGYNQRRSPSPYNHVEPNRSSGSDHRNFERRSPSPYRTIDYKSNQENFRRWRSPNRSPSPDDNRCEMKRQQDDFRSTRPNDIYNRFENQNAFIRMKFMEYSRPKSPVNNGFKDSTKEAPKVPIEQPTDTGEFVAPNLKELREIMRPPPLLYRMPLSFWGTGFRTKDYVETLKKDPDYKYPHYSKDRKWTEGIVTPSNEPSFLWETQF